MYKTSPRLNPELIFVAFIYRKTNQSLLIRDELNSLTYALNLVHITTPWIKSFNWR